jgi:hypothetical protein
MDQLLRYLPLAFALLMTACTGMGTPNQALRKHIDYGETQTVNVCLYLDKGITEESARKLIDEAWRDEGPLYGIEVNIAQVKQWARPAFHTDGIMAGLRQERLEAPCDRIFAMVARNFGDVVWSFMGPEVLGAVNDETLTHGYAVAQTRTFNQLLMSPVDVTRHEIYHMLGCDIHYNMPHCYEQIAKLKAQRREEGGDFFPAWDLINKRLIASRDDVNARLSEVSHGILAAR